MKTLNKIFFATFLTLLISFGFTGQVWAVNSTEIVSKSTAGVLADQYSDIGFISGDGRYIVFSTNATNLVAGDTNAIHDTFLRDTQLDTTVRVSVSTAGVEGNNGSYEPRISSDGRYIVFSSDATNLVAGDTNGVRDVFVRDTQLNTTTRVSISTAGTEGDGVVGGSEKSNISSNGRYVTFVSDSTNLVAGDTNAFKDVFVRDTQSNTTTRVSVSTAGAEGNDIVVDNTTASISNDGRYVFFQSTATNLVAGDTNALPDVFMRDTQSNTTTRVSVSTAGAEADQGVTSDFVGISADGRYLIFTSESTNLVTGDTGGFADVFLRDTQLNTTTRVSVDSLGVQGNGASYASGGISSDGRYITFVSEATNLVDDDTNSQYDAFLLDTQTNTMTRVSVSSLGVEGNDYSGTFSVSNDGQYVSFYSDATNLVSGDTNGFGDIFLYSIISISTPTTTTTSASSITTTTAVLTGNITDTGGENNTERGFDLGTDNTYTMTDVADVTGSYSTGSYSLTATGLTCATTYHYRAYSTNTAGTGTGSDSTFATSACPSSSGSSGSSASSRASNLINMGKIKEAQEIINQFPNVVNEVNNLNTVNKFFSKKLTERIGSKNNNVKEIQIKLNVKADGIFGPITQKAVINFQTKNNLKVDGIVGPETWATLEKVVQ